MGQFSKWKKNVPNCPVFPNILFSFSYNLVKIQYSPPQGNLQAIHNSHFKKESLQIPSLTDTFLLSLCSLLTDWEDIEYLCFYSASLMSSEQHQVTLLSSQVSSSPSPGSSCSWPTSIYRALTLQSSVNFTVDFLAHLQIGNVCYGLFTAKMQNCPHLEGVPAMLYAAPLLPCGFPGSSWSFSALSLHNFHLSCFC